MNILIPQLLTQEIIFKCVSSLTTTIVSSYNLFNFISTQNISDYQNYQNEITSTDLANKLLVASSLIKDIIKKHHFSSEPNKNIPIEKIIDTYKDELKIQFEPDDDFDIISHIQNNQLIGDVPEPIKISLSTTLEIMDRINVVLEKIHEKMKTYSNSYVKYVSKLNIKNEVDQLINLDKIFDKRLGLLIQIVKIYIDVVK
jgi:hypothetical protein